MCPDGQAPANLTGMSSGLRQLGNSLQVFAVPSLRRISELQRRRESREGVFHGTSYKVRHLEQKCQCGNRTKGM